MDPNQPIINLILDYFPGNDIDFRDGGYCNEAYLLVVNHNSPILLPKELLNFHYLERDCNEKVKRVVNFILQHNQNSEINLHPKMFRKSTGVFNETNLKKITTTLLGNEVDTTKPVYLVLLESFEPAIADGYLPTYTTTVGIIQEYEMPEFSLVRLPNIKNITTIKKR